MPGRPRNIPTYRERSALQSLVGRDWLPAANFYPAGPSTISGMLVKGWLRRKRDTTFGWTYRVTVVGEAALKILIPSKQDQPTGKRKVKGK